MSSDPACCAFDGFDHLEEFCCNCLKRLHNWRYFEEDACKQCRARAAEAAAPAATEAATEAAPEAAAAAAS